MNVKERDYNQRYNRKNKCMSYVMAPKKNEQVGTHMTPLLSEVKTQVTKTSESSQLISQGPVPADCARKANSISLTLTLNRC